MGIHNPALVAHIQSLEESLLSPSTRNDYMQYTQLLADDFFEFGSSGQILYKNVPAEHYQLGTVNMTLSDFELHCLSEDIVLATYKIYNADTQQFSLRSSIWQQQEAHWKMKFHQGTRMP